MEHPASGAVRSVVDARTIVKTRTFAISNRDACQRPATERGKKMVMEDPAEPHGAAAMAAP
jgi:hypothetical protein